MPDKNASDQVPLILTLRQTIQGHVKTINRIAWSPDGSILATPSNDKTIGLWNIQTGQHLRTLTGHTSIVLCVAWSPQGHMLASGSADNTIRLWNAQTGQYLRTFEGHSDAVLSVAWSPDGRILASCSEDHTIGLWNIQTGQHLRTLTGHTSIVLCVAWSPQGHMLASGSADNTIRLWNAQTGQYPRTFEGHSDAVLSVAWSPDGRILASCSEDHTIGLWNFDTGQPTNIFEGHTDSVQSVSFSCDGHFLASKSHDGTVRIWRIDTQEMVAVLDEPVSGDFLAGLAFSPIAPILATLDEYDTAIRLWNLDVAALQATAPVPLSVRYTNAKIVLVGDSGVGKSGLGLVLTAHPFVPTASTHGRHIWNFENREVALDSGRSETRETLLWDLAGQPGYRLVHQLHLSEIVVALVIFDSHSETDPFAGVAHWVRALQVSKRIQGSSTQRMKMFLIAARIDGGGKSVSRERIDALVKELNFDGYFETSAKEGQNITELIEVIKNAIDWDSMPKVTSTVLFQRIKTFLVAEKEAGRVLSPYGDLYRTFVKSERTLSEIEDLYAQFETCIGRVESQGLIRRLSFGNLILLQPELLDVYASALVNTVRGEPDGLGSISEEKVRTGNFLMPKDERLTDREQEKLLLIAMVEDLLRYEIALREQGEDGPYLVFPSQSTRENPDLPDPEGKAVIFGFQGPVLNIYATLAVRLSHSGLFQKKELWKNAVTYTTKLGGVYGLFLKNIGEGRAELILFFDKAAKEEARFHFEEYVETHLQRQALSESIQRRRIFSCPNPNCETAFTDTQVARRRELGFNWIRCSVCDTSVSLLDREVRFAEVHTSLVPEMDRTADTQREREVAASIVQGKNETREFDVFLCYNNKDKTKVIEIGEQLKEKGLLPWLDEWELPPGRSWQRLLQKQIGRIKSAAVFVGKDGMGPWQQEELESFLSEFVRRGCSVIPVLLVDASKKPRLPLFLKNRTWVDFRKQNPDPMMQLIWGITGMRGIIK